jgi:UDPglucose 6-dehydrogenase
MKIGIIGNGFVGSATKLLGNKYVETHVYDILPEKCCPIGTNLNDIINCDLIFICVPTPMKPDGSCGLKYVDSVMDNLNQLNVNLDKVILRSTVPVGTCNKYGVHFMPEFLTEKNWEYDVSNQIDWIIGLSENSKITFKIDKLFFYAKIAGKLVNNPVIHYSCTEEAELCKYVRNTFLATKISYFCEIEEFCGKLGINFNNVRKISTLDTRIGNSHSNVPGHDGKRGFGGICLPKDIKSLQYQYSEKGVKSPILDSVITRNETVDRPLQDWLEDVGRAVMD